MRRLLCIALWVLVALVVPSVAMANQSVTGWCETGAIAVVTSGLQSSNQVQGSFPQCQVEVLVHGGGIATIFADNLNTPLANPFLANTIGQFSFYGNNGRYDIVLSGGGNGGLPSPVTISDVLLNDPFQEISSLCTVAFTPTPTFTANLCSIFSMTLTGNVTSSGISGALTGQVISFNITNCMGSPCTLAWPSNFFNPPLLTPIAGASEQFTFALLADGNWHSMSVGESMVFDTGVNGNVLRINGVTINAITGTGANVLATSPTIITAILTTPAISNPTITGTVAGGATYTAPTLTSPTITGTVAGGASYTAPTLTGTIGGGATYTSITLPNPTSTGTDVGSETLQNKGLMSAANGNNVTLICPFQGSTGAITGNSMDQLLWSCGIPANVLGPGKGIRLRGNVQHTTGSAAPNFKLSIGGVTFSGLGGTGSTNGTRSTLIFEFFNNVGVQNAQTAGGYGLDSSGTSTAGVLGMPTTNFATGGTITIGITFNAANTNAVTGDSFWGELIQ
jgi:hypothetical protein